MIQRTLVIAGTALLVGGFIWLWWQGVPMLYRNAGGGPEAANARLTAVTTTRAALLAGFVGIGALGTFWLNSRVYRITAQTFELTERGHLTDRYSKAIEQLGDNKLDVRLGGIYALEQIATDSPRQRDQATIVEVLSAFVRVHSDPLYQYKTSLPDSPKLVPELEPTFLEQQRRQAEEYVVKLEKLPVDVQAAVTVLGRLPVKEGVGRGDLLGAWLVGANLFKANLTKANLHHANLTRAILIEANLTRAMLSEANLTSALLERANLTRAKLMEADLTSAQLPGANLTSAVLAGAHLKSAELTGAIGLTQAALDQTIGNARTQLPDGMEIPARWTTWP